MVAEPSGFLDSFWAEVEGLRDAMNRLRTVNVNSEDVRVLVRQVVQDYFRHVRPELSMMGIDTGEGDAVMQSLLGLSNGKNRRKTYQDLMRRLGSVRCSLETEREKSLGERLIFETQKNVPASEVEISIARTLKKIAPPAALSYEQARLDLLDKERVSYRGTASELREALRETLDHLAPDDVVMKMPGFKPEKERSRPTMSQRVRFILKSRGQPANATRVAEEAATIVETSISAVVRSAYDRASVSVHKSMGWNEARQLKRYVDTLLCELLEI